MRWRRTWVGADRDVEASFSAIAGGFEAEGSDSEQGVEYGLADNVFRGNELDLVLLPFRFVGESFANFRI